jgi:hypothetical protein
MFIAMISRNSLNTFPSLNLLVLCAMLTSSLFSNDATAHSLDAFQAEALKNRANTRWELIIHKNDRGSAYGFLSPASRAQVSVEAYRAMFPINAWKSSSVADIQCESETKCLVKSSITMKIHMKGVGLKEHQTEVIEPWAKQDGIWYLSEVR